MGYHNPCLTLSVALAVVPGVAAVKAASLSVPLTFEANQGQTDPQVRFLSRGSGYALFLTSNEAVLSLTRHPGTHATIRTGLLGARRSPQIDALDRLPGQSNYFAGNDPSRWRTGVPTFARVRYKAVYPGVDLVYYGSQGRLEYDFIVGPGANPRTIRLSFRGVDSIRLDGQGDLILSAAGHEFRQHRPVLYQEIGGQRREVAGRFVLRPGKTAGFQVGRWIVEPRGTR